MADKAEMPLLDHLEELRRVFIFAILATMVGCVATWAIADWVLSVLTRDVGILHFAGVTEAFYTRLKVALVLGFLVVLPAILYRVWRFVVPALFPRERRVFLPLVGSSSALFYLGMVFAFFGVKPIVVRFFLGFTEPGKLEPVIMVGEYFGFVAKLCLAFGAVFQLPLVVCFLSWAGIVDPDKLSRGWRYAVVISFLTGALLTPPDIISQLAMAVPLLVLFMGSVLLSRLLFKRGSKEGGVTPAPGNKPGVSP